MKALTETGQRLETVRISNESEYLHAVIARAGEAPEAVLEATSGWDWAADTLAELGARVHLAHPLGVKMFSYRRIKMMTATRRIWRIRCGWAGYPRHGLPPAGPGVTSTGAASGQAGRAALGLDPQSGWRVLVVTIVGGRLAGCGAKSSSHPVPPRPAARSISAAAHRGSDALSPSLTCADRHDLVVVA
jgi:hypothetical protein